MIDLRQGDALTVLRTLDSDQCQVMRLESLRVGDFIYHGPTKQSGTVAEIEDCDSYTKVTTEDNVRFLVTEDGFRLWWIVERDEIEIKGMTGDLAVLLNEGRVV